MMKLKKKKEGIPGGSCDNGLLQGKRKGLGTAIAALGGKKGRIPNKGSKKGNRGERGGGLEILTQNQTKKPAGN